MPLPNDASSRSDPASRDDPTTALVEVGAGMAVLFADRPPSEMELIPFSMMGTETTKRLTDRLAIGAGLVNTGVQGVQGALPAQGLVRLAPQTLEALKTAVPVQSGGWTRNCATWQTEAAASLPPSANMPRRLSYLLSANAWPSRDRTRHFFQNIQMPLQPLLPQFPTDDANPPQLRGAPRPAAHRSARLPEGASSARPPARPSGCARRARAEPPCPRAAAGRRRGRRRTPCRIHQVLPPCASFSSFSFGGRQMSVENVTRFFVRRFSPVRLRCKSPFSSTH